MNSGRKFYIGSSLFYLVFLIYGSLIPFRIRDITLAQGWETFSNMPFLKLGAASRADWIANIILYLGLGFLLSAWRRNDGEGYKKKILSILLVLGTCWTIAVTIEFLQTFFSPRTVSSNDLIAEFLGANLGVILWNFGGKKLESFWRDIRLGGRAALTAAMIIYLLVYILLSLFPYDVLVSFKEWQGKLSGNNWGFFWADFEKDFIKKLLVTIIEIAMVVPLVFLFALITKKKELSLWHGLAYGLGLGTAIELLQLGMASGVSQGASIIARGIGGIGGVWLARNFKRRQLGSIQKLVPPTVYFSAVPYLLITIYLSGWFRSELLTFGQGLSKLNPDMFLPFFYHYFSTETKAVASVLLNIAMYFPFGMGAWLLHITRQGTSLHARFAVIFATLWCFFLEAGKLFFAGRHPDFTNLLFAMVGSWAGLRLSNWIFIALNQDDLFFLEGRR